jgi:hypothetical protein
MGTQATSRRGFQWSIGHLMAWTVGCALGFGAYGALSPPWQLPPKTFILGWAYNLTMGAAFGTILTGAGIMAYRRWRGDRSYPFLPGHWLLTFGVAAALADAVAVVVFRSLLRAWFPPGTHLSAYWLPYRMAVNGPELAGMYNQCVGWGLGAAAALAFCWHLRGRLSRPWFAVFLVFLLASAMLAAVGMSVTVLFYSRPAWGLALVWFRYAMHIYVGFILLGALTILAAIALDRWSQRATDGLHWAGVAAWLAIASIQAAVYFKIIV